MVRVGIVGVGFMGMVHYLTYQKLNGVEVTAICSRTEKRRQGDWRGIQGNFGPPGTVMDLSGITTYESINEMLQDPKVDVIDITLPPALHAEIAIRALKAGKHVFCEKPISLQLRESEEMIAAAKGSGKQLMIGHVLPFFPEYIWAREAIDSGRYGRLLGGTFRRVISDPAWLSDYWNAERIGGPMLDLHVHDAHFIRAMFGMPDQVTTSGRMRGDLAEYWTSQFQFADRSLAVTANSGVIRQQGRSFLHGFEIHLEQATLTFEFSVLAQEGKYTCEPVLIGPGDKVSFPELGNGDPMLAFEAELQEVVTGIRSGTPAPLLEAELARDAVLLCHKQTESLREGKSVRIG